MTKSKGHKMSATTPLRVLIINPNTTSEMTTALHPAISSLNIPAQTAEFTYFTCPSSPSSTKTIGAEDTPAGIPSINSPADAAASARACIPHLIPLVSQYDAFLVACYSEHPLVQWLRAQIVNTTSGRTKNAVGIFEASVAASLLLCSSFEPTAGFGIVSTGAVWEKALAKGVEDFVGGESGKGRFLGCETTGLNADELHRLEPGVVREKMKEATKRVVANAKAKKMSVKAVCLGCAGMVGLEVAVREALAEALGKEEGEGVFVVDGVKAGVGQLVMLAGGRF